MDETALKSQRARKSKSKRAGKGKRVTVKRLSDSLKFHFSAFLFLSAPSLQYFFMYFPLPSLCPSPIPPQRHAQFSIAPQ